MVVGGREAEGGDQVKIMGVFVAILFTLAGCKAISPANQYVVTRNAYVAAVDGMATAAIADAVTLEQAENFEIARVLVDRQLDQWEAAVVAGESFDRTTAVIQAVDDMTRVWLQARAERETRQHPKGKESVNGPSKHRRHHRRGHQGHSVRRGRA